MCHHWHQISFLLLWIKKSIMCINKHKKTCQFPKQTFSFRQNLEWFWAHSSLNISVIYVFPVIQLLWLVWGRLRDVYKSPSRGWWAGTIQTFPIPLCLGWLLEHGAGGAGSQLVWEMLRQITLPSAQSAPDLLRRQKAQFPICPVKPTRMRNPSDMKTSSSCYTDFLFSLPGLTYCINCTQI